MGDISQQGFHIAPVDCVEIDGSIAGPFATLMEALVAQLDIALTDEDNKRIATEIIFVDENEAIYVRWKKQWALEEVDGTVDTRAPLPEILKVHLNG